MTPFLSLRPEGEGADVRLLFHHQPTGSARVLSGTAVHVVVIATLLLVAQLLPDKFYEAVLPQHLPENLVYLIQPGPGGGGGGGNRSPKPPAQVKLKGAQELTVPAVKPEPQPVEPEKITEAPEQPAIPAQPMAAATQITPGSIAGTSDSDSRGIGDGPGAGRNRGPGDGDGGPDGIGKGPYRAGNGVLPPRILQKVDPQYSADAMHAKIQGAVLLSAVVLPDGSVTDIRVIRSLDRSFGLDMKAIEAARQWRFLPGTRLGEPVPVLVNIELEFHLR
jgi:protein TonB